MCFMMPIGGGNTGRGITAVGGGNRKGSRGVSVVTYLHVTGKCQNEKKVLPKKFISFPYIVACFVPFFIYLC